MIFGPIPTDRAEGAILAHSVQAGKQMLRKGRVLTPGDLALLREAGLAEVVAARLEAGDIDEDSAAAAIGTAVAGTGLRIGAATRGRCNLHAETNGLLRVDTGAVWDANLVDEGLTLATAPDYARLSAGQLAATAKIIPYGASRISLDLVTARLRKGGPALELRPFRPLRVLLLLTRTPGMKPTLLSKGEEAVSARISALGSEIIAVETTAHETPPLAAAIGAAMAQHPDLVLILAASATSDRADVAPSAIVAAGGRIERFGMPVDPGNLLVLARIAAVPVITLPGCARSPALNGTDWVLERIAADIPVTGSDIAAMGVGGLLKEIPSRPQPREADAK